jgi:hypothetical protein
MTGRSLSVVILAERPRYAAAMEAVDGDMLAPADFLLATDLELPASSPCEYRSAFALTFHSSRDFLHLHHILRC